MKLMTTCLFLLTTQIFSQTYLSVSYSNANPANSTDLSSLQKITFSETDITFTLTDNSTAIKAFSIVDKLTFSGSNGGDPLPVELVSFTAAVNGNNVQLEWSTATEVNNYGFEIERKAHPNPSQREGLSLIPLRGDWGTVGFVEGHGNSNSKKEYSFTDQPQGGTKFNYRLKQIDNDGKYQYSSIVEVEVGTPTHYVLKQNYPNPFNPQTKISFNIPVEGFVTLKIFDVVGREVTSIVNENKKAGSYEVIFDGSGLASGFYLCRMSSGNYNSSIKMISMK